MCIVVDTNSLHLVFGQHSKEHEGYEPVLDWILNSDGCLVYGGTKYLDELKKARKYIPIITELRRTHNAIRVNREVVDSRAAQLVAEHDHKDFNDQHLVALLGESGCILVCCVDKSAHPFIKNQQLYTDGKKRKIYCSRDADTLLTGKHVVKIRNKE